MSEVLSLRQLFASVLAAGAPAMTYREGPHGERMSLLGYGAMRLPTHGDGPKKGEIDQDALNRQVRLMLDGGVNFFDTSPAYCRGQSERCLGEALKASGTPRPSYFLSTKMSNFARSQQTREASQALFEQSLKNLNTDYFDVYLLHSVGSNGFDNFHRRYVENGMIDWLVEQKRKGRIRNLGFSYHGDARALDWLFAQHDSGRYHFDIALLQVNYVDWRHGHESNPNNLDADYLYRETSRRGIKAMVMEPLLGGRLAKPNEATLKELVPLDPEATPASWAFRFAGHHPEIVTVLSGMTFTEHIRENLATFSPLKPLSEGELLALERAAQAYLGLDMIPCTDCRYCMPCPYGIDIPACMMFMNEVRRLKLSDRKAIRRLYGEKVPDVRRRADRCIGCGRCQAHCPQRIDIPKTLDKIAAYVEDFA